VSADEEIAPYLAKGCAIAGVVIAAVCALIYFAIRGIVG
jgi:hypothetical protein